MKIKRKGAYGYKRPDEEGAELGWHSNHSALVVPKAAEQALVHDEDIGYFIKNHRDEFDFCLRAKVPRSSRLVVVDDLGNETQVQNICRYYISNSGDGYLVKIMPPINTHTPAKKWQLTNEDGEVLEAVTTSSADEQRYTKKGYTMVEEFEMESAERRIGINTGWKVKVCNNMDDFNGDINYEFYIEEAKKLVDNLEIRE